MGQFVPPERYCLKTLPREPPVPTRLIPGKVPLEEHVNELKAGQALQPSMAERVEKLEALMAKFESEKKEQEDAEAREIAVSEAAGFDHPRNFFRLH